MIAPSLASGHGGPGVTRTKHAARPAGPGGSGVIGTTRKAGKESEKESENGEEVTTESLAGH